LQKKVESKRKKQKNKSILEKNERKKNVSKELRTYLTLEATINYVNYVYLELSLNVWKLKSLVLEKKKRIRKKEKEVQLLDARSEN